MLEYQTLASGRCARLILLPNAIRLEGRSTEKPRLH